MKTILLAMSAVSAIAAAAPAAAQYAKPYAERYQGQYQNQYYGQATANGNFDARINQLQARLDAGVQQGAINSRDAWSLRRELRDITRLEAQYGTDGLDMRERAYLQQRLSAVGQQIQVADRGAGDRYGRGERYGTYDNGGYDRQGYGSNGAYANGYSGQGGPYEEVDQADVCQNRGGVGGVVDALVGGGCLRVGQRATANLGGVPYDYRGQYRDGGGVYYRSDGRAIYQIDARTNTILEVYPVGR
jgi:hypothetical protein